MKSLKQWQETMQDYILTEINDLADAVVASPELSAEERIEIYRQAYFARLITILVSDFPALQKLMDEEAFAAMIRDYLVEYPPIEVNIHLVGERLPQFLAEKTDNLFFVDLARFEWLFNTVVYAANVSQFTIQDLAAIPQEQWSDLILNLHPSVRLMQTKFNLLYCWECLLEQDDGIQIEENPSEKTLLIWRFEQEPFCAEVSNEEAVFFSGLQQRINFSDLCEMMLDYFEEDEVVVWVADRIQYWISQGVFANTHRHPAG